MNFLNTLQIPDLWQMILSIIIAVGLVYLVEWLKQPTARISIANDLTLSDNRKLLKVKVLLEKKGWYRKIFPWTNMASNARLRSEIISPITGVAMQKYIVKWDTSSEPWDYEKNKPRLEMLPLASSPENLLPGDEVSAAVAVKHDGEDAFYLFDGNYYVNRQVNERTDKEVILQLTFVSSTTTNMKEYVIVNGNKSVESFSLKDREV